MLVLFQELLVLGFIDNIGWSCLAQDFEDPGLARFLVDQRGVFNDLLVQCDQLPTRW